MLTHSHLGHERHTEAALVLVAGRDSLLHAGNGVVQLARPTAPATHVEDRGEHLGVETESELD